jgi:tetratricopeptide (TPR) repeat protein
VKKRRFPPLLVLFLFCGGFVTAQVERPYWYTMEQGKFYFREGDYGSALMAFEDARRQRRTMYTRMEQNFINFLSTPEVRRLGDSLTLLETYIGDRGQTEAAAALGELYYRRPRASLNDSAAAALTELGRLKDYPEAEYWIGEVYRVEGELGLAIGQFRKAYGQRALLETPGFEIELLYKIADINRIRREYTEMERTLLEIIEGTGPGGAPRDSYWSGESGTFTRTSMERALQTDGINRFLTLYRYNNSAVEKAHRLLGFYYYAVGRHTPAAEHLMFAFLLQNTVIIEEVIRSRYDFTFSTLDALMGEALRKPELAAYIEDMEYYRTAYYLGTALYATGKPAAASGFWNFLSNQGTAGEWRGRAQSQLRTPLVDQAVETP